jgi:hypothetical protein
MARQVLGLLSVVVMLTGCAQTRPAEAPRPSTVEYLMGHDASGLSPMVLVGEAGEAPAAPPAGQSRPSLAFQSERMWRYVLRYGREGNDCPDGQFDSDCAHFQSHALAAGGVRVDHPSAACVGGMSIRVKDLAIAFDNAAGRYENVKKFSDYRQARRGDFCFLARPAGGKSDHMMFLAATPDPEGALVYSHTNNRYGTKAPFDPTRCVFYRIEDR